MHINKIIHYTLLQAMYSSALNNDWTTMNYCDQH